MILMNSLHDKYSVVKHAFSFTGMIPSYSVLTSAMKIRELKLKAIKARFWSGLIAKGKKQGKQGSKNTGNKDTSE